MKKYKLDRKDKIKVKGKTLYRIIALKDFYDVKKGERGGYVESEDNLSHEGDCWVYDEAKVYGEACVYDDAEIRDNAKVYGMAYVNEMATVKGDAHVYDSAKVSSMSVVKDHAVVLGEAAVFDGSCVGGYSVVEECSRVFNEANIINIYANQNMDITGPGVLDEKSKIGYFEVDGIFVTITPYRVNLLDKSFTIDDFYKIEIEAFYPGTITSDQLNKIKNEFLKYEGTKEEPN